MLVYHKRTFLIISLILLLLTVVGTVNAYKIREKWNGYRVSIELEENEIKRIKEDFKFEILYLHIFPKIISVPSPGKNTYKIADDIIRNVLQSDEIKKDLKKRCLKPETYFNSVCTKLISTIFGCPDNWRDRIAHDIWVHARYEWLERLNPYGSPGIIGFTRHHITGTTIISLPYFSREFKCKDVEEQNKNDRLKSSGYFIYEASDKNKSISVFYIPETDYPISCPVDCGCCNPDDKNPCTSDICDYTTNFEIMHIPISCNDNDVCTTDSCDPQVGCVHTNLGCDDGNTCTKDMCDPQEGCTYHPVDCNDNNSCTVDSCDTSIGCINTPLNCNDDNLCTEDTCNPESGFCEHIQKSCNDDNPCTVDLCNPNTGLCGVPNIGASCNDNNDCTINDFCQENGNCLGTPKNCDDNDPSTFDYCVDGTCINELNPPNDWPYYDCATLVCDDGNPCNGVETCDPRQGCQPGTQPNCDDNNACTDDYCDPTQGCQHSNNNVSCDDNNACTGGDICSYGNCIGYPVTCDDGNICNGQETCDSVRGCITGTPFSCDDNNNCTADSCDLSMGCVHIPIDCDYNKLCTPHDCNDNNMCTRDSCDPQVGCVHTNLGCDDGNACTEDMCDPTIGCYYNPVVCTAQTKYVDDDINYINIPGCDPSIGCYTTKYPCDEYCQKELFGCNIEAVEANPKNILNVVMFQKNNELMHEIIKAWILSK